MPCLLLVCGHRWAPRVAASRGAVIGLQCVVMAIMLTFTLPLSLAPFPVTIHTQAASLEPHIAEALAKEGSARGSTVVSYFRGM